MAQPKDHEPMPGHQADALSKAYGAYRNTLDQSSDAAAAGIAAKALSAGWSRRSTAAALGIPRTRLDRLVQTAPAADPATAAATFPASIIRAFKRAEDAAAARRATAAETLAAMIRSAHRAGWPYSALAAALGVSAERARQLAGTGTSTAGTPAFDRFVRILKEPPARTPPRRILAAEETVRLHLLAEQGRKATRNIGRQLGPDPTPDQARQLELALKDRRASEELSALIIRLKRDGVPWAALDAACGYRPGSARARALRHGYAPPPPSMKAYTPTPEKVLAAVLPSLR